MSRAGAITPGDVPRFDVVQAVTPVGTAPCAECRARIVDTYYEWDGKVICGTCQSRIATTIAVPGTGGFARALGFGLAAAVVAAAIYFGSSAVTGYDVAPAMILAGFLIGRAVRIGSGGRGGRRYQWLAASLTYAAIASTYVPFVTSGFGDRAPTTALASVTSATAAAPATHATFTVPSSHTATPIPTRPAPAHLAALLLLATAAPLLAGFSNIPGIAITIVAVLIAWRINRPLPEAIVG
ncbi:MAG TPA: hypothetical protein VFZ21_09175, partial [Gemmatimonadaceae bacterium]|nr:hypothetical protein [Gemmatimonadaceae bacterium]